MKNHRLSLSILVGFLFLCFSKGFAQQILDSINNKTIVYGYKYKGLKINGNSKVATVSKYIIDIKLDESANNKIKQITKKEWLELLTNETTDWAANLLLYYLYKKDAIDFYVNITKREYWIYLKQHKKDIKYWKQHLPVNGYK